MSVLRNIWSDLVEKKLWPVAALLAIVAVAVPVVLGSRSSDTTTSTPAPAPAAPAAAPGATAAQAQVSLDTTTTQQPRDRKGSVRDPFKSLHPTPATPAVTTGATATGGTTATPGTTTTTGGTTAPSGGGQPTGTTPVTTVPVPTTTTPTPTPAAPNPLDLWRTSIRFGKAGKLRVHKDMSRLTPLPSSQFPFFIYLGVLDDMKTAVFMISSDVTATGDGTCRPSKTNCQTIELQKGDTEFFDYAPEGDQSNVTQFQLDVLSVHKKTATSTALAAQARSTTSKTGTPAYLAAKTAKLAPHIAGYQYSRKDGMLHRVHSKAAKRASAARVPKEIVKTTQWGVIAKIRGAVGFMVKTTANAAHA